MRGAVLLGLLLTVAGCGPAEVVAPPSPAAALPLRLPGPCFSRTDLSPHGVTYVSRNEYDAWGRWTRHEQITFRHGRPQARARVVYDYADGERVSLQPLDPSSCSWPACTDSLDLYREQGELVTGSFALRRIEHFAAYAGEPLTHRDTQVVDGAGHLLCRTRGAGGAGSPPCTGFSWDAAARRLVWDTEDGAGHRYRATLDYDSSARIVASTLDDGGDGTLDAWQRAVYDDATSTLELWSGGRGATPTRWERRDLTFYPALVPFTYRDPWTPRYAGGRPLDVRWLDDDGRWKRQRTAYDDRGEIAERDETASDPWVRTVERDGRRRVETGRAGTVDRRETYAADGALEQVEQRVGEEAATLEVTLHWVEREGDLLLRRSAGPAAEEHTEVYDAAGNRLAEQSFRDYAHGRDTSVTTHELDCYPELFLADLDRSAESGVLDGTELDATWEATPR